MSWREVAIGFGVTLAIGLVGLSIQHGRSMPRLRGPVDDDDGDDGDDDFGSDDFMRKIAKRRHERETAAKQALATSPAIIIDDGHSKRLMLVTGEMQDREHGTLRVTTFNDDGPSGHATRRSMDEIAQAINEYGWKTLRPASETEVMEWTSTEKFVVGSKKTAAIQALNTLHFRAKDKDAARSVEDRANKLVAEGKWDDAVLVLQQGIKDLSGLIARAKRR